MLIFFLQKIDKKQKLVLVQLLRGWDQNLTQNSM